MKSITFTNYVLNPSGFYYPTRTKVVNSIDTRYYSLMKMSNLKYNVKIPDYYFNPEGELLNKLGTKGMPGEDGTHFYRPTDITAGLNGQFYVSDGYGNKRVARFNKDLNFIGQWGSEGEEEGQFVLPHAITTDPEGLVYVCDRNRWRVQIFTPSGEYLTQWTHIGKAYQIVYTPDNCFFICDGNNSRVWKLEKSGKIIGFFSSRTPEVVARGETTVHDMALAPNGDILLAHLDGVVQLFSPIQ